MSLPSPHLVTSGLFTFRRGVAVGSALALVLAAASSCVGTLGDGRGAGGDAGGTGTLSGSGGEGGGAAPAPKVPFDPLPVASYVAKVKALLTGLAPTEDEITAVTADATTLGDLVDQWMKLPAYSARMEQFFADAFQQSQAHADDFQSVIDDGQDSPNDRLLLNFRQSFAKTVTELNTEARPFTEVATTRRYMMTTAMMTYFAYADTSLMSDATASGAGTRTNRFLQADPQWSFRLTTKSIPLADSGNPASPDYLTFTVPTLKNLYGTTDNAAHCSAVDPVVYNNQSSFAYGDNLAHWLYHVLLGAELFYFDPPQDQPGSKWCRTTGTDYPPLVTDSDYSDWRMVTVQQPKGSTTQTRFFDLAGNRASSTLTLYSPRVGYFTTPAFFSQYSTNVSNQARATINQTMIVGLGQAFSPGVPAMLDAPGFDADHASDPACVACHWSLDPMRRFFRSSYSLNFSQQSDPAQQGVPGTFLFGDVVGKGSTIYDLGDQIASHARFKTAWTAKLCAWANSTACDEADPELGRIAKAFEQSKFQWSALVHELFTSPIVTYASPTLTTETHGAPVPIARRGQLCATLDNRLGLADACGLLAVQTGQGDSLPALATHLPSDQYSRGQVAAIYVNEPDPFFRGTVEKICALVADEVVDAGPTSRYQSSDPTAAIADMVHALMGLGAGRDTVPIGILTTTFEDSKAAGADATLALKSAFTLACISPAVVSVGQ